MKNKKMKLLYLSLLFFILNSNFTLSQKSIQINGSKMYQKVSIKMTSEVAHVTACTDSKLSKNCKYYFQTMENEFLETSLSNIDANIILKSKGLKGVKNIGLEKLTPNVTVNYLDNIKSKIYFVGFGKDLNIVEYVTSPNNKTKRPSIPENIACRNNCNNTKESCINSCFNASDFSKCRDGCFISFIGCTGICDNYVKKYQIQLKNILIKPITIQN